MAVSSNIKNLMKDGEDFFKLGKMSLAYENFSAVIIELEEKITKHNSSLEINEWLDILGNAYNYRGQIKYLRVDFDEAVDDYSQAIKLCPHFAIAYYNRGQIHYRLGRFHQGIEDFKMALRILPDFPDAHLALKAAEEDLAASLSAVKS